MSRSGALIIIGVVTLLAPLSGLPIALRSFIVIICGAVIISIGLRMRTAPAVPTIEIEEDEVIISDATPDVPPAPPAEMSGM